MIFVKLVMSFLVVMAALMPTWFWLAIKDITNPEGFWQTFVLLGVGMWFLGGFQIVFLIIAAGFVLVIVKG